MLSGVLRERQIRRRSERGDEFTRPGGDGGVSGGARRTWRSEVNINEEAGWEMFTAI